MIAALTVDDLNMGGHLLFLTAPQNLRKRCREIELFTQRRVIKSQSAGVQPIAGIARQSRLVHEGESTRCIKRVAFEGMANRRQVNANLMRTSR